MGVQSEEISRLEDIAYCLMGLFDVNMPLFYGKGQKAFMRLQHEIVKTVDDESIFAWKDGTLLESGMFASSPAAFVDSGDIVSIEFPGLHRPDRFEVTNRALSIEIVIDIRGLISTSDHPGTLVLMPTPLWAEIWSIRSARNRIEENIPELLRKGLALGYTDHWSRTPSSTTVWIAEGVRPSIVYSHSFFGIWSVPGMSVAFSPCCLITFNSYLKYVYSTNHDLNGWRPGPFATWPLFTELSAWLLNWDINRSKGC